MGAQENLEVGESRRLQGREHKPSAPFALLESREGEEHAESQEQAGDHGGT